MAFGAEVDAVGDEDPEGDEQLIRAKVELAIACLNNGGYSNY